MVFREGGRGERNIKHTPTRIKSTTWACAGLGGSRSPVGASTPPAEPAPFRQWCDMRLPSELLRVLTAVPRGDTASPAHGCVSGSRWVSGRGGAPEEGPGTADCHCHSQGPAHWTGRTPLPTPGIGGRWRPAPAGGLGEISPQLNIYPPDHTLQGSSVTTVTVEAAAGGVPVRPTVMT